VGLSGPDAPAGMTKQWVATTGQRVSMQELSTNSLTV
jgi:hypothetical protein